MIPAFIEGAEVQQIDGRWGLSHEVWCHQSPLEARPEAQLLLNDFTYAFALRFGGPPDIQSVAARAWIIDGNGIIAKDETLPPITGAFAPGVWEKIVAALTQPRESPEDNRAFSQRAFDLASRVIFFERAFTLFSRCGSDFPQLWITYEYVREHFGGVAKVAGLGGVTRERLAAFAETADRRGRRHAIKSTDLQAHMSSLTYPEVTPEEARKLVHELLLGWLDREMP